MLGISPQQTVWLVSIITVVYAALGGLRGVILTDFFQFGLSMLGLVVAAIYIVNLPEVGGLSNLLQHQNVVDNIAVIPDLNDWNVAVPLFLIPLAVQWWSTWYPGAEPGGGGYIAQRMLSAKTEEDAEKATMFFNFAHYALRPWPWIIIALASMVVFPDLQTIQAKFLHVDAAIVADDLAFSAMLTYLPKGLLGLVIAALIAALMSTISTHLNWGASYVVNDFYIRIIEPKATEKTQIVVGRMATVVLMLLAALVALYLKDAMQSFNILLQIGAGTGLLFLLRWFWWRINAFSEIAAMLVSLIMAIYFQFFYVGNLADYQKMLWSVGITTFVWILVTLLTRPSEEETLEKFVALIKPHPYGWRKIIGGSPKIAALYQNKGLSLGREILMMFLGVFMIYAALFFTGYCLYGNYVAAIITGAVSIVCMWLLYRQWQQR